MASEQDAIISWALISFFFLLRVDIRNGLSGLVLDPGPLFSSGCAM